MQSSSIVTILSKLLTTNTLGLTIELKIWSLVYFTQHSVVHIRVSYWSVLHTGLNVIGPKLPELDK